MSRAWILKLVHWCMVRLINSSVILSDSFCLIYTKEYSANHPVSCTCVSAQSLQTCLTLFHPVDYSPPGSSVHGILQQEYRCGFPFPSPGYLPDPGVELASTAYPELQADSLPTKPPGKPIMHMFSSVQSLSHVWLFVTPWIAAHQASLSITNSRSLPKPLSIKSVMLSSKLILCRPLLLLPPILPGISVFSDESALHMRWPKYWSFSFNISPSNEHSGLISFRMDWLDLLAVQGTLKSLLQHHSSKESILLHSAFFIVQLSHLHMTIGKIIALTRQTFVGKVMSLLLNMLSSWS